MSTRWRIPTGGLGARARTAIQSARAGLGLLRLWREAGSEELLWLADLVGRGYGHFRTVREGRPIMPDGSPIPWYTYPAIEYLSQLDFQGWDAFEYGGGQSSAYWARRCRTVTTVESDPSWHAVIVRDARPNQTIYLEQEAERYAAAVTRGERQYQLIVIDGQHRAACAEQVMSHLAPGGIVLFDNSDWWPRTTTFLRDKGLLQVDFAGIGPINRYTWTTSLFFSGGAVLTPAKGRQPLPGIGSLDQVANPE